MGCWIDAGKKMQGPDKVERSGTLGYISSEPALKGMGVKLIPVHRTITFSTA